MQIIYVGPFDAVDLDGYGTVTRDAPLSVSSDVAGRPPAPRLAIAMQELADAVAAIDHDRAAALRAEIVDLDSGTGLLAQPSNWVPAKGVPKKEDEVSA